MAWMPRICHSVADDWESAEQGEYFRSNGTARINAVPDPAVLARFDSALRGAVYLLNLNAFQ